MSKPFRKPKASHKSYSSIVIGFAFTLFLFLAIPLTQIFTNYEKNAEALDILEIAPDPPPPYIEEQPTQPVEKKDPARIRYTTTSDFLSSNKYRFRARH